MKIVFFCVIALLSILHASTPLASDDNSKDKGIKKKGKEAFAKSDLSKELKQAIEELDKVYDSSFEWWGKIYDLNSGGFFYSISSKKSPKFGPFIEATSKGIKVLQWSGLLGKASQKFKDGVVDYFHKRQSPSTGFFMDPEYKGSYTPFTLERAIGMSTDSITKCGGKVLYPTPLERTSKGGKSKKANKHYKHLESPEKLRNWLSALPWELRVWTAGSRIRSMSGTFLKLKDPKRGELLKVVQEFVNSKQNKNGMFGNQKGKWYSIISGSYKVASFLDQNRIKIENTDMMLKTTLLWMEKKTYDNLIVVYNTANMLNILHRQIEGGFDEKLKLQIVKKIKILLETFKAPDGGFVTVKNRSTPKQNGFLLAEKVIESDTNATGLAHKTRYLLLEILTGESFPHPHIKGTDFLKQLPKDN